MVPKFASNSFDVADFSILKGLNLFVCVAKYVVISDLYLIIISS